MKNVTLLVCTALAFNAIIVSFASAQTFDSGAAYTPTCPRLTLDLKRGDSDATRSGQVTELQNFIADYYDLAPSTYVTGFFGRMTEQNVRRFQTEHDLPSIGRVGPLTRTVIARVCTTSSSPSATQTQSSPSSGNATATTYTPPTLNTQTTVITCPAAPYAPTCSQSASPIPTYSTAGCITGWSCPTTVTTTGSTYAACTFNGTTIAHGSSVSAYSTSSAVPPATCTMQTRTCSHGVLSGDATHTSCAVVTSATSCTTPWGSTVSDGASVSAYQEASVTSPARCVAQTRTCTNGALSGSYTAAACSVRTIATTPGTGSCTIQGTSQPEGTKLTRKNDGSPFLICDNGTWLRDPLAERGGADYQHGDACSHINFGPITVAGYSPADFGCSTTNINNRVFIGPRHGTRAHTITAKFSRLSYEVVVPNTGAQCLSYTIDWGDGTVESEPAGALGTSSCPIVLPTKYHTYSAPGSYTVSIRYTGQVPPNQTNPYTTAIRVD